VKAKSIENIFNKIIAEILWNLGEKMAIQLQEALEHQIRPEKNLFKAYYTLKHWFCIKKERMLKTAREKYQVTYKGKLIRITDFPIEILKARKACNDVCQP
jgi:hypothetical protein